VMRTLRKKNACAPSGVGCASRTIRSCQ
jgi:hypothetical protein